MAKAGNVNLYIEQGATFSQDVTLKKADGTLFDLTGATFSGQIRSTPESSAVLASFTASIVGDPVEGKMNLLLSVAETRKLPARPSGSAEKSTTKLAYDVYMTQAGVTTRLIEGTVEVSPGVTR